MPTDSPPRSTSFPTPPPLFLGSQTTTAPVPIVPRNIEALDIYTPQGNGTLGARSRTLAALELAPTSRHRVDEPFRRVVPPPVATTAGWETKKHKAARFLNDLYHKLPPRTFNGVRISLDATPGHGHQGSSVGAYRQLRALGFAGHVQFLCKPTISSKLRALLYGAEKSNQDDWLDEPNTSWVEWLSHGAIRNASGYVEYLPPCPLVIAGGMDIYPSKFFVENANAERGICLQPLGWHMQRFVVHNNKRAETLDLKNCETQRENLAVHCPFPTYDHYGHFLQPRVSAPQAQVFVTLRAAQNAGHIDTCCMYGQYDKQALPVLLKSVRKAQKRKNSRIKPTAILWFGAKPIGLESQGTHVKMIDTTSPEAVQAVVALAEGQARLRVFTCGRVPQDVCHDAFLKGTLPAALEGACSENLLRLAQKPYVKMVRNLPDRACEPLRLTDLSRSRLPRGRSDEKRITDAGLRAGHEAIIWVAKDNVTADSNKIARFIHQAASPTSRVSCAYASLGGTSLIASSDALLCGLDALRRHEARKPKRDCDDGQSALQ